MLKLIYYQWRYSWKEWTATVPVFFMASLISGISLSGDFNIIANKDVLLSVQTDPSPVPYAHFLWRANSFSYYFQSHC